MDPGGILAVQLREKDEEEGRSGSERMEAHQTKEFARKAASGKPLKNNQESNLFWLFFFFLKKGWSDAQHDDWFLWIVEVKRPPLLSKDKRLIARCLGCMIYSGFWMGFVMDATSQVQLSLTESEPHFNMIPMGLVIMLKFQKRHLGNDLYLYPNPSPREREGSSPER